MDHSGLPHQCTSSCAHDHHEWIRPKKSPRISNKDWVSRSKVAYSRKELIKPDLVKSKSDRDILASQDQLAELAGTHGTSQFQEKANQIPDSSCCEGGDNQLPASTCTEADQNHSHGVGDKVGNQEFNINTLQPDDVNFPKLQSPNFVAQRTPLKPNSDLNQKEPNFVWKSKQDAALITKVQSRANSGKEKLTDSAPLTRQGYRSGRLAEDLWTSIGMPQIHVSNHKLLKVIPFFTRNRLTEQPEYLVDKRGQSFSVIAHVQIAESLAGVPWTESMARQHVVNEVSQTLHKTLIFNNNLSSPFQRWTQGHWYAQWEQGAEGEYVCTLYVSIDVPEHKVKPRKGNNVGWRREPVEISATLASNNTVDIQVVESENSLWKSMAGRLSSLKNVDPSPPEFHNRFATLLDEEASSDQ